jgi:FHA domain
MAVCPNGHDSASDDFCDVCGMRIATSPGTPTPSSATGVPGTGAPGVVLPGTGAFPTGGLAVGQGVPAASAGSCPRCGTARTGQFCESCGFNFASPPSYAPPASPPSPPASPASVPSTSASPPSASPEPVSAAPPSSPQPLPPPLQVPPMAPGPGINAQVAWTAVVAADRAYYDQVRTASGSEGEVIGFPAYYAERRFRLAGTQMRIGRRSVSRGLEPEIDLTGPPVDPGISRLHAVLIAAIDGGWAVLDPGSANGTLVNGAEVRVGDQVPLHDGDRINLGAWTAITVYRG